MRTDELRTALRELADDEQPLPADLTEVRRRDRRHKTVVRVSAALVVLVVAAGVFAVTRNGAARRVEVSNSPKLRDYKDLARADFMVLPANSESAKGLDGAPVVVNYARIPQGWGTSGGSLFDAVGVRESVCALQRSDGYVVEVNRTSADERAELQAALPVGTRVIDLTNGSDIEVFMKLGARSGDVAAVSDAVARFPGTSDTEIIDQSRAYEEFKRIFANQPALIEQTTPSLLPESVRANTTGPNVTKAVATAIAKRPGVDTVVTGGSHKPELHAPLPPDTGPSTTMDGQPPAPSDDNPCTTP